MAIYIAFGVNIGNLGSTSNPRIPIKTWVPMINERLMRIDASTCVISTYGHTGNFVVSANTASLKSIARNLTTAVDAQCVVFRRSEIEAFVNRLRNTSAPKAINHVRWTPGGVFLVSGVAKKKTLNATERGVYERVSKTTVAVWKKDLLDSSSRLDRTRRQGGWGGLSVDVSKQIGGIWTARSISTLLGILRRSG